MTPTRVTLDPQAHVAGGPASGQLARTVVRRLPSAGEPLARTSGEPAGHDLSQVRVHRDAYAADTAHVFGARALTAGRHVLMGAGPAADHVLAHEVGHAVAQARTGDAVVQLDAIDQVQELMSYGVLDWAVTDSEAMEALALLNALPDAQLAAGLARLDRKYTDRLLDNLPDAARSGPGYQRVVQALGAAKTVGNAVSELDYGLFDWAVTDVEVTRVYNTFVNLQPTQQEPFLMGLDGAGRFGRLVSNSSAGHLSLYLHPWMNTLVRGRLTPAQLILMRTIITKSDDLTTLQLGAAIRFDMVVGPTKQPGRTPAPWDAGQLRSTYLALEQLPESHTARNASLTGLGQFEQAATGTSIVAGVYLGGGVKELAINRVRAGDFDNTVRHETGHSVDEQINWSTGPEPAKPTRGGWLTHASHNAAATDMVADAAAGIAGLVAAQQTDVVADIATAMTARSTTGMVAQVKARPWYAGLPQATRTAVTDDPTFAAVTVGLQMPWLSTAATALGRHVHHESYAPTWVRHDLAARARLLTAYQFRDEGEWFAEAYAWYYAPDSRGKGMKLNDKDPNTKQWFDANVDTVGPSR